MESTPQNKTNTLLESIDIHTTGIIWVPEDLNLEDSALVYELDYFFDGTISSGIHHHGIEQGFSLFTTNNFGNDLKLGLMSNVNKVEQSTEVFLGLVARETSTFKILLIQNKINKSLEKAVEKKLSKYKNSILQKLYF